MAGNNYKRIPIAVGLKVGRLTVVGIGPRRRVGRRGVATWSCVCDCGTRVFRQANNLRENAVPSCGCYTKERVAALGRKLLTTHGYCRTDRGTQVEYGTWYAMIKRCVAVSDSSYGEYGGRGIAVCDRWRDSFAAFLHDMGQRPSPDHSIERKDNSSGYHPGNCVWATRVEQQNNTRRTVRLTFGGITKGLSEWARDLGINYRTLRGRVVVRGWPVEKALTVPSNPALGRNRKEK